MDEDIAPDLESSSYVVCYDFVAENDSEINVSAGMRVNVLRKCDKSGNNEWWLVERGEGGDKGYIPESFLSRETASNTLKPQPEDLPESADLDENNKNPNSTLFYTNDQYLSKRKAVARSTFYTAADNNDHSIQDQPGSTDIDPDEHDEPSGPATLKTTSAINGTYILEYDFEALNTGELGAKEGQLVTCLDDHDEKGNPEWWLVEYDGQRGYIPRDYLSHVNESEMC